MGYEFLDYNRQLKEIKAVHDKKKDLHGAEYLSGFSKDDKLQAVCTLVIYYGKAPWTGPTRLSEMLDLSELPEAVRNMVADYPIHIIDARRFTDSEKLETEEGDFDMCKAMDDLIKRGEERGEMKIIKLIQCMVADGASNLIPKIAEEADFCEKMFAKYDIG